VWWLAAKMYKCCGGSSVFDLLLGLINSSVQFDITVTVSYGVYKHPLAPFTRHIYQGLKALGSLGLKVKPSAV
jgi:hypothetical protein